MEKKPAPIAEDRAKAALRVGLLLDSFAQPAWARKLIADLQASPFARVALVVKCPQEAPPGLLRTLWLRRHHLLHDLYVRLDDRIFRGKPDAFAPSDVADLLRGCPVVESADLARTHDLDVIVALGSDVPAARYARAAKHGVWALRHGDGPALPGLSEVMEAEGSTGSLLEVWSEGSEVPKVIYRSFGTTDRISVRRNRNPLYWRSAAFVVRKLRDLAAEGPRALEEVPSPEAPPLRKRPTNLVMAGLLVRHALRYLRKKASDLLFREQWYLAYRFESAPREGFLGLVDVMPPEDAYWADPFPVRTDDGATFLFFEELRYGDPKGRILGMEIDPVKGAGKPFPVLERGYHLSYPQVFRWQGQYYMIPESSANGTVTLFRCVSFPDRWVEERDLLRNIDAVDATVFENAGRWWMFVNVAPFGAGNKDELHLYHADTPLGPWMPHARNPVKSDCRAARPAGLPFRRGGQLHRPAQDCSGNYGSAIVLHRVLELTPEAFREAPVERIVPIRDPKAERTHTINRCEGLLVLDLMRRRRRFL